MADIGKISRQAVEQARKATAKAPVAKTGSVAEFQDAMRGVGQSQPQGLSAEQMSKALGLDKAPGAKGSVGDAILNNIEKSSSNYKEAFANLNDVMSSSTPMNTSTLLQVQFQMTQITVMQEMMSKIAGKLTQGLQQLYKNQ